MWQCGCSCYKWNGFLEKDGTFAAIPQMTTSWAALFYPWGHINHRSFGILTRLSLFKLQNKTKETNTKYPLNSVVNTGFPSKSNFSPLELKVELPAYWDTSFLDFSFFIYYISPDTNWLAAHVDNLDDMHESFNRNANSDWKTYSCETVYHWLTATVVWVSAMHIH